MADDAFVDGIAERVADGSPIDWAAVESRASGERERALLAELRLIDEVARADHSLSTFVDEQVLGEARASRPSSQSAAAATAWGHLQLIERIGEGAFGEVFRALDPTLQREVALKLLRRPAGESLADRLLQEGRLLARVRHPNVVTVHGAAAVDGRVGIWMELVQGQTLEDWLHVAGPAGPDLTLRIAADLAKALAAVHAAGAVHRDVKPRNVMREPGGRLVLTDFGLCADAADAEERLRIAGTPACLAPEVLRGAEATFLSDIYSLGVLLFHVATGLYPVSGRNLPEVTAAHEQGSFRRVRDVRPDFPAAVADLIDRAMAADPRERFRSAEEMAAVVEAQIREVRVSGAGGTGGTGRAGRHVRWLVAALLLAALGVIAAGWQVWHRAVSLRRSEAATLRESAIGAGNAHDWPAVVRLARQAVDLDDSSAPGHIWLAWGLWNTSQRKEALAAAEKAFERRAGASEAERRFVEGSRAMMSGRRNEATAAFEAVVRADPSDYWSINNLRILYREARRFDDARACSVRMVDLRRDHFSKPRLQLREIPVVLESAYADLYRGDRKLAEARVLSFLLDFRKDADPVVWAGLRAGALCFRWLDGDARAVRNLADELTASLKSMPPDAYTDELRRRLPGHYVSIGRLHDAEEMLSTSRSGSVSGGANDLLAVIAWLRGDEATVKRLVAARPIPNTQWIADFQAWALVRGGRMRDLERLLADPKLQLGGREIAVAAVALASGRAAEAAEGLEHELWLAEEPGGSGIWWEGLDLLVEALERSNRRAEATAALERASLLRSHAIHFGYTSGYWWVAMRGRLAEMYRGSGRIDEAVAIERELLNLLSEADPDFRLAARLRALHGTASPQSVRFQSRQR